MSTNFNIDDAFGKLNCTMCGEGTFMCDCDQDYKQEGINDYNDVDDVY